MNYGIGLEALLDGELMPQACLYLPNSHLSQIILQ